MRCLLSLLSFAVLMAVPAGAQNRVVDGEFDDADALASWTVDDPEAGVAFSALDYQEPSASGSVASISTL